MEIKIPEVLISYPNEDSGKYRDINIFNDYKLLQFNFHDHSEQSKEVGSMTLDKTQILLLRDALNLFIKNKLVK